MSPATDEHGTALAVLAHQAVVQLQLPPGCVRTNGLAWVVPGGSGDLNVPDLAVVAPGWVRVGDLHLAPPPLLLVEVASPSTRRADRGRKLADYRLGGAGLDVLVDLAGSGGGGSVIFDAHDVAQAQVATVAGTIDLLVAGRPLPFDLTEISS